MAPCFALNWEERWDRDGGRIYRKKTKRVGEEEDEGGGEKERGEMKEKRKGKEVGLCIHTVVILKGLGRWFAFPISVHSCLLVS